MAAGPALHIFPPVEQVNRRRESLDNLIRKSMDMRPTGPWPLRNDNQSPIIKSKTNRTKTAEGSSPSDLTPSINVGDHDDKSIAHHHERTAPRPSGEEIRPKANHQMLPPIQVPKRNQSRPRRQSSVSERNQRLVPVSNLAQRRAISPASARSPASAIKYSPLNSENDDQITTPASAQSINPTPVSPPERDTASRSSNRRRVVFPNGSNAGEVASFYTPGTQIQLERRVSSRASNRSRAPLQRQVSSRGSRRTRAALPGTLEGKRSVTPALSDGGSLRSGSPTLVRSNSTISHIKNSSRSRENGGPIHSMFPVYNPSLPLAEQSYKPQNVAPLVLISPEKVSKPEYSPNLRLEFPKAKDAPFVTPASDLASLWSTANGQMSTPDPRNFSLKMFRPSVSTQKKQKITFGSSDSKAFYTLSKSHPISSDDDDEEDHELLISRHHTSKEDILPISHLHLQPPPPPTISKSNRASVLSNEHEAAVHITTIAPILATLHSLDSAAKTPQAHTLALVDPNATSPAAARLAERAVAEATARESCTLTWTPTCPRTGKYELHHPSLGVFTIVTEGDVGPALENGPARGPASISVINPYANMTPLTTSPSSLGSASSGKTVLNDVDREGTIIARLDLQEDILRIEASSIQQLGNLYLIDVCVSAVLAVAVAEAKRPEDPGLIFAAPPPSLLSVSARSKKIKTVVPKKPKKAKKSRPGSLGMGIEHLADAEDLPRITKGVLSVLGFSFKTAVWMLAIGVKVTAGMVIGISKMATKE
jgi:hypothetical protein